LASLCYGENLTVTKASSWPRPAGCLRWVRAAAQSLPHVVVMLNSMRLLRSRPMVDARWRL